MYSAWLQKEGATSFTKVDITDAAREITSE
jgi:hypothetical protein